MKAGIIGGTGKMGRLFCPVFERAGYETIVSGRSTALTNEQLAESCDIVIVSVPIRDTVRVIGEIAPVLRDDQLLCDFTSLKVAPVAAMLRSKAQVIGLHPMFGPTVSSNLRPDHRGLPGPHDRCGARLPRWHLHPRRRGLHARDPRGARQDDGGRAGAHALCHDLHGRHPAAGWVPISGRPKRHRARSTRSSLALSAGSSRRTRNSMPISSNRIPFVPEVIAACRVGGRRPCGDRKIGRSRMHLRNFSGRTPGTSAPTANAGRT